MFIRISVPHSVLSKQSLRLGLTPPPKSFDANEAAQHKELSAKRKSLRGAASTPPSGEAGVGSGSGSASDRIKN
ncbi:MAG TPA: hypothetical protein VJT50_17065 [Pyrinomonadaceae bacterium]|nr:hypothetical protein [Pyrinomonadaceae bacterium]